MLGTAFPANAGECGWRAVVSGSSASLGDGILDVSYAVVQYQGALRLSPPAAGSAGWRAAGPSASTGTVVARWPWEARPRDCRYGTVLHQAADVARYCRDQ